ncbi:MAG: hypothetical protein ACUVS3_03105 [Thermodesulfobacteriota bacterium]
MRLRGHLWRHETSRRSEVELAWRKGRQMGELLRSLGVSEEQVMLILVRGNPETLSYEPLPGDDIEVLPVIDGG